MKTASQAIAIVALLVLGADRVAAEGGALGGDRPRVIISTDIGGTDPDDYQSMVHLLLYADVLDIEVVEFALPVPAGFSSKHTAQMIFDNRIQAPGAIEGERLRFRFAPRDAKVWAYTIASDFPGLGGQSGRFTAVPPPIERTSQASKAHPNWWTDDPDPAAAEGNHPGAKTVNQWRVDFLRDFAARMRRCETPKR